MSNVIARVVAFGAVVFCFLAAFAGVALAQPAELIELAKPVLSAIMGGNYMYGAALALVLMVAAARRYGAKFLPFLVTDAGGALLALLGSFGGALATSLASGAAISGAMAWTAVKVAVAAAGGYSLIKRLLVTPVLEPLAAKAPAPIRMVLDLLLWAFRSDASAKAVAAGEAAVVAKPSSGAAGIVGEPTDIDSMGGR